MDVYTLPLAESGHLQRVRQLRTPEKGGTMTDTLTALTDQLAKATREFVDADKANTEGLETMLRRYLQPHFQEPPPKEAPHDYLKHWRQPQDIGNIALTEARLREEESARQGILYLLAEILIALHRNAQATQQLAELETEAFCELHHPHNP